MQTTEIFIEQVLIGAMVLLIGALPFYDVWSCYVLAGGEHSPLLLYAAVFVAAAYLLGIPFDRFIDARMSHYDKHIRARYALDRQDKDQREPSNDPFPEDRYRTEMLSATETGGGHFNYLRSTMRLSRALTVCVPGLTVAGIAAASSGPVHVTRGCVLALVAICYFVPPTLGKLADWAKLTEGNRPPRTDDRNFKSLYATPGHRPKKAKDAGTQLDRIKAGLLDACCASLTWTHVALFVLAATIACLHRQDTAIAGLAAAGIGLTALSGWAWWRITQTYMTYLWLLHKYGSSGGAHCTLTPVSDGST